MKYSFNFNEYRQTLIIIALIICFLAGAYLYYKFNKFQSKRKIQKLRKRGEKGEEKAKKYLLKHGYKIIEEQPEHDAELFIDEQLHKYKVRADFLVEYKGVTSIVEVKTGNKATDPASIQTRRQLLEYSLIYKVDQLLFFDAETFTLHSIRFPENQIQEEKQPFWGPLIFTFIAGIILGAVLVYYFCVSY